MEIFGVQNRGKLLFCLFHFRNQIFRRNFVDALRSFINTCLPELLRLKCDPGQFGVHPHDVKGQGWDESTRCKGMIFATREHR